MRGHAELLRSADAIDHVKGLLARSWVPAERTHHVRIAPESITGRSIDVGRLRRTDIPPWVQQRLQHDERGRRSVTMTLWI